MKKTKQRQLVLIGISRKGEKSFKTILKAEPDIDFVMLKQTNHIDSPDKKQFCGPKSVE
jgi:hypothetical protein